MAAALTYHRGAPFRRKEKMPIFQIVFFGFSALKKKLNANKNFQSSLSKYPTLK